MHSLYANTNCLCFPASPVFIHSFIHSYGAIYSQQVSALCVVSTISPSINNHRHYISLNTDKTLLSMHYKAYFLIGSVICTLPPQQSVLSFTVNSPISAPWRRTLPAAERVVLYRKFSNKRPLAAYFIRIA